MVKVEITNGKVWFEVQGLWIVFTMRRQLTVAREHITGVRIASLPRFGLHGVRAPGTHLPGVIVAGTFHQSDGRSFYCVTRFDQVLIVDLVNEHYRHLLINVKDAEMTMKQLTGQV